MGICRAPRGYPKPQTLSIPTQRHSATEAVEADYDFIVPDMPFIDFGNRMSGLFRCYTLTSSSDISPPPDKLTDIAFKTFRFSAPPRIYFYTI